MNIEYHYPTDLLQLLVETIPLLCKSKRDILMFFTSAGIDDTVLEDLKKRVSQDKDSISKYEIVRVVLTRLNERGELALRERREILKRVVEREDFSTCWESDRLKAQGLVAQIQKLVNAKDTLTKINLEREAERKQKQAEYQAMQTEQQRKRSELSAIKTDLASLYSQVNPQKRGKTLESVLNRLFKVSDILVHEAFTLTGFPGEGVVEQIDGAVEIDGLLYLVEMKWWNEPVGVDAISRHNARLYGRAQARGIFIAEPGYTKAAIVECKGTLREKLLVLCELKEIVFLLDQDKPLKDFLKAKIRAALLYKEPLYYPLSSNYR